MIRRITNLFKDTNIHIAFRATNTILQQLSRENAHNTNPSGIHKLQCNTCNKAYIGQSDRSINTRYKEHIRYIRSNNPQSAYAMHILQNRHEYGPAIETLQLLKACTKGTRMSCWENMYMQTFHNHGTLITEEEIGDPNPLYNIINESTFITDNTRSDTRSQHKEEQATRNPTPSHVQYGKKLP